VDDRRLDSLLRTVRDPIAPDPAFVERLYADLAPKLGFQPPTPTTLTAPLAGARRGTPVAPRRRWRGTGLTRLLAALLAVLALTGAAVGGAVVVQRLLPRPTSLMDLVRERGALEVMVRDGYPQSRVRQGTFGGFEVDLATEVARRVGVRPIVIPATIEEALAGDGPWQLALVPRVIHDADRARFAVSQPIIHWPVFLVVKADDPLAGIDALAGRPVCAVDGSVGADWLRGEPPATGVTAFAPAPAAVPVLLADDQACLDGLAAGTVAAIVTQDIDPARLTVLDLRAVGGPVLEEEHGALLDRRSGDVDGLVREVDAAIEAARADGTLADLSRSH
jgi:ABC-type amino acid transport substrate-binding protein